MWPSSSSYCLLSFYIFNPSLLLCYSPSSICFILSSLIIFVSLFLCHHLLLSRPASSFLFPYSCPFLTYLFLLFSPLSSFTAYRISQAFLLCKYLLSTSITVHSLMLNCLLSVFSSQFPHCFTFNVILSFLIPVQSLPPASYNLFIFSYFCFILTTCLVLSVYHFLLYVLRASFFFLGVTYSPFRLSYLW